MAGAATDRKAGNKEKALDTALTQIERSFGMEIDIVDDPGLRRHEHRLKVARTSEDVTDRVKI